MALNPFHFGRDHQRRCPDCGGRLSVLRSWRRTDLRCRSCNARFPLERFKEAMDEELEEELADVRCDRL